MSTGAQAAETTLPEEETLRADLYALLAKLLSGAPDQATLQQLAALTGDDSDLGSGITALARVANITSPEAATREYNALFIGLGRGELLPYASYYLTGFLNEKPLATLRNDMTRLGIERAPNVYEPEDNIASLSEMMAGMIRGRFFGAASLAEQKRFFNTHVGPWAGHFYSDLEAAKNSVLYAPVGAIGKAFIEIEKEAFRMAGDETS